MACSSGSSLNGSQTTTPLQILENIHEQLVCAICLDRLHEPKFLSCLHSFCCQCLHRIANQEPRLSVTCPTCRTDTVIPEDEGINGLKTNFFVNSMLDLMQLKFDEMRKEKKKGETCEQCQEHDNATSRCIECDLMLCGSCVAEHKRHVSTIDHRIVIRDEDSEGQSLDKYTLLFCRYHTRNVIKYFCNTCDEAVCRVCTILDHREHQFVYPKEAIPQQKPIIESLLTETCKHLPNLQESLVEINKMKNTLKECRESIESEINAKVQSRIDALLLSKQALLDDLNRVYERKQKTLTLQSDGVELELGKLSGCCSFAENILSHGNEVEVLQIKSRLQQLNNIYVKLDPEEDDSIQFCAGSEPFENVVQSLGKITFCQTYANLSSIEGDGLESPRVGVESCLTVIVRNRHGRKKTGGDKMKAHLVFPDEQNKDLVIKDNDDGSYEVKFQPEMNGMHILHVSIQERPVKDSPFQIMVINRREYNEVGSSILRFGQYGSKKREFKSPFGVACDADGMMFVADSYNHRVQIFGPRGEFINTIGSHGDRKGEFNCPTDVAVSPDKRLVVCDNGNNRVQIFQTRNGGFVGKFGREGVKNGNFKSPWGIAISPRSQEIIVADTDNHRIQVFTPEGKFIMKFGTQGERFGQFNSPCYVAVNAENEHILVSDSKNHRIQIFDKRGKYIQSFGAQGQIEGHFNHPRGLSMDIANNIIVSDMGNHRLQILTYSGKLIKSIGTEGNGDGQLSFPESVAVNPNGYIVVSDLSNNRIQVF